jgi:hypothetical protein
LQIKTKIVSCHTADSNPVKQEVNGTVILPPLVFPAYTYLEELLSGTISGNYFMMELLFETSFLKRSVTFKKKFKKMSTQKKIGPPNVFSVNS